MSSSFNENIHSGSSKGLRKKGENPMRVLAPVCTSACVCVRCVSFYNVPFPWKGTWSTCCMESI